MVPLTDPGLIPAGMGASGWRRAVLPHVLVVLASAGLSFVLVMAVMRLRDRTPTPPPPRPEPPAAPAVLPHPVPPTRVAPHEQVPQTFRNPCRRRMIRSWRPR